MSRTFRDKEARTLLASHALHTEVLVTPHSSKDEDSYASASMASSASDSSDPLSSGSDGSKGQCRRTCATIPPIPRSARQHGVDQIVEWQIDAQTPRSMCHVHICAHHQAGSGPALRPTGDFLLTTEHPCLDLWCPRRLLKVRARRESAPMYSSCPQPAGDAGGFCACLTISAISSTDCTTRHTVRKPRNDLQSLHTHASRRPSNTSDPAMAYPSPRNHASGRPLDACNGALYCPSARFTAQLIDVPVLYFGR